MTTMKENLKRLKLNIELTKAQYDYRPLADYESYMFKTIDGEEYVELKGKGAGGLPFLCTINLNDKHIREYRVYPEDDDLSLLSSIDKDGYMPFY